jgi:hypothetical protein
MGLLIESLVQWVAEWADYLLPQSQKWWFWPLVGLMLVPVIVALMIVGLWWFWE